MKSLKYFGRMFGLHPLTAMLLIVVDWMLFGEEIATAGAGWLLSLPVGFLLGVATILIQRYAHNDRTGMALAKGLVAGVLTAIPAPLSSLGLLPMAAFGAIRAVASRRSEMALIDRPRTSLTE